MHKTSLNNLQIEILKLYSTDMEKSELLELKRILAKYFAHKAISEADQIWKDKNLNNEKIEKWLYE